jgi:cysteinyl-tRNA synthetase
MHGGGKDLLFPHHENERAQAECATGRGFANYWVHNGFVAMDREKMSKSLGNILLIKDFLKSYHADVLRLFFLSAHYRNPVDYAEKHIESADSALGRLYATLERVSGVKGLDDAPQKGNAELGGIEERFFAAMDDDFNTALALSSIFDLATALNRMMDEGGEINLPFIAKGKTLFLSLARMLGFLTQDVEAYARDESRRRLAAAGLDESHIEDAIRARIEARRNKDYTQADEIRSRLSEKGIALLDTPEGTKWRIKK